MSANGTPGPWFIEDHGVMDATRSRTICIFGDSDQDDADLALVASAPMLREQHEATLRVLYHVVSTYNEWRSGGLGMPNEFTDDAVRIGREHLQESNWWPS